MILRWFKEKKIFYFFFVKLYIEKIVVDYNGEVIFLKVDIGIDLVSFYIN